MKEEKALQIKENYTFDDLLTIMSILRAPGGCPWDIEQTHQSIRKNLIEEAYEVCEGIDSNDDAILCEELGDLLLQVVFHAQIAQDDNRFTINEVADGVCKKLIRRHPHIFADVKADTSDQVLENWDQIKKAEKAKKGESSTASGIMKHIFRGMPALMRAQKVQGRAAKVGFDWDTAEQAADKLSEERDELFEAVTQKDKQAAAEEAGDLLFAAVNVVRKCGVDAEEALSMATDKFIARFTQVEQRVEADGKQMSELPLEELDKYWDAVKGIDRA